MLAPYVNLFLNRQRQPEGYLCRVVFPFFNWPFISLTTTASGWLAEPEIEILTSLGLGLAIKT